jgi:hypothetical protein
MNTLNTVGIPQRESIPDKLREKLLKKMKPEDRALLPITPATIITYGRIGAGKSSIMYSFLKNMFPKYFDEVIIFCSSADSKEAFESLPQKSITFLTDYDNDDFTAYIESLKADQIQRMEEGKRPLNVFVGADDIVFSQAIGGKGKPSALERLMMVCRHELNTTCFICVQHSKQVNPAMRNNTLYHILCPLQRNDLEKVASEHCNHLTEKQFIDMYNEVMDEKHCFIVIDYKAPEESRFRKRFNVVLETK